MLLTDSNTTASGNFSIDQVLVTVTYNQPPSITSNGGGASASISVAENASAVTTVTATDPNSDALTYSISGGLDAALFAIDSGTGALSFVSAPDFETPADNGGNNVYDVTVQVSDGSLTDTQAIAVTVTDVVEGPICTPAAMTLTVDPAAQNVRAGFSVTYTVTVTNNDSAGCSDLTVNLAAVDAPVTPDANFALSTIGGPLVIAQGASGNAILTVTAQAAGAVDSVLTTTVTASAAGHADQIDTAISTIKNIDPMMHNSLSTGSLKWSAQNGWGIAGGKYGEFTCATCHGKNTGNIKRVKTAVTAPNTPTDQFPSEADAARPAISFQKTASGVSDFGDDGRADLTKSANICETCHTYDATDPRTEGVKFHGYDMTAAPAGNKGHYNKGDCLACHPHKQGFKPLACDSCHGYPPTTAGAGGPTGLANSPYATGSTTAGSHAVHLEDYVDGCNNCHSGYVMPEDSTINVGKGNVSIGFNNFGSLTGSYTGQLTTSYSINGAAQVAGDGNLQCSAVYCHGATIKAVPPTPVWNNATTGACGTCHNATAATPPTLGSHVTHAGAANQNLTCDQCHLNPGSLIPPNIHVTGTVNWSLNTASAKFGADATYRTTPSGATAGRAPSATYGSCASVYCHSTGQSTAAGNVATPTYASPQWGVGATGACGTCHPASGGTVVSASHAIHYTGIKAAAGCTDCHTSVPADHVNGSIDLNGVTYTAGGAPGNGYGTCSAASCHQDGLVSATHYVTTPTWGANPANCTQCHAASPTTGSHAKHIASTNNCSACHTNAVKDASYASAQHIDLNIDVAVGGYAANKAIASAYASCTSVTCHSDGMAATGNTPVWGAAGGCAACHASNMTTGSHAKHLVEADCGACHADAVKDTTAPTGGVHADGNVDVYNTAALDLGYPANVAYGSATWTTCTAASCHDKGRGGLATTPAWGVAKTDCTECHAGAAIATGSHASHLLAGSTCTDCHDAATNVVTETSPAAGHRDTNIDTNLALGYTQNKAKDSAFTTCATASCHNDGRNNGLTGTWGATLNNCSECHATVPATGGHAAHIGVSFAGVAMNCDDCHTGTTQGTTAGAGHRDGNIDAVGYATVNKALGTAYTNCTTASCHQNGLVSTTNYVATPNWDLNTANCTQCHAAVPATGSHAKHVTTAGKDCSACHTGATKDTAYGSAAHGDLNIDVAVGGYAVNKAIASAYTNCTNLACHSDGMTATGNTPVWGAAGGCASCHASNMATGSHAQHLAVAGVGCGACHADAVKDSTAPTGGVHTDGNVDVYDAASGDLGYPANVAYGSATWTTCTSISCHDPGRGAVATTPAWGSASTCASCHATRPTTGSHSLHFTSAFMGGTNAMTCARCHNGTVEGSTASATDHLDGNIDVYKTAAADLGYTANKTKASAFTACATSYCHGDNMPRGTTSGTNNNPTWGAAGTAGCGSCHGVNPAPAAIGAHSGKALTECINCHNHVNAAGTGFTDAAKHINGTVEAQVDDCTTCHGNADLDGSYNGVHAKHTAQSLLTGKKRSLNDYGAASWWYSTTYVNGEPKFGCGQCHPNNETGNGHPGATGLNVDLDPAGEASIPAGNVKLKNSTQSTPTFVTRSSITCTNVYCHSTGQASPTFKTSPNWYGGANSGNCTECHANVPATGAHSAHDVTIHNTDIYAGDATGGKLAATAVAATNAAHGNGTNATTINCNICHSGTVTVNYNAANTACSGCHSDTNAPATGNERMVLDTAGTKHVNGSRDVSFATMAATFKSKAQLRNDITTVPDLNNSWTRSTYKSAAASNDTAKRAPGYDGTTCSTVDCHNGKPAKWVTPIGDCLLCHGELPQ